MTVLTLSSVTRSAACSNVSPEISSTIFDSLGSEGTAVGAEELSAGAVASHLALPVSLRIKLAREGCLTQQ